MSENRRQHFVPEFYLSGFTADGERESFLHVLDQTTGKQWRARPRELAHQRDLYRVEVPGTDPNIFEKTFGQFEGQIADVLRELTATGVPPEGEAFSNLMFFAALMAVRIPRHRAQISKFINEIAKNMTQLSIATPEHWEATKKRMVESGHPEFGEMSYEEAKKTFRSDQYTVDFPQTWHVGMLFESAKAILPTLGDREWTFIKSDDAAGDFVCSDYPVGLVWASGEMSFYPPGFGLPDTEVSLPLTREWAMVGSFEGTSGVGKASRATVAAINSRTCARAQRVFSGREDFTFTKSDGAIGNAAELLAMIQSKLGESGPNPS
jgi:hypothetical protein